MLDIVLLRKDQGGNPDLVRESQRRRYADVTLVDQVIAQVGRLSGRTVNTLIQLALAYFPIEDDNENGDKY